MNDLDLHGKLTISFETIRRLAIQCHALDISTQELFYSNSKISDNKIIQDSYSAIYSETVLNLAIAIRTKIYQGYEQFKSSKYTNQIGSLYIYNKLGNYDTTTDDFSEKDFSIKDVCDKIIHSTMFSRSISPGEEQPTTMITGKEVSNRKGWELYVDMAKFCLVILEVIDDIDTNIENVPIQ